MHYQKVDAVMKALHETYQLGCGHAKRDLRNKKIAAIVRDYGISAEEIRQLLAKGAEGAWLGVKGTLFTLKLVPRA